MRRGETWEKQLLNVKKAGQQVRSQILMVEPAQTILHGDDMEKNTQN